MPAYDDSGFFGTQDLGQYGGTGGNFGMGDAARLTSGLGDLASIAAGLFAGSKRRSAAREIPGLQEALNAAMASRTYASAAADPNSAWFKNLAALFREAQTRAAIEGIGALRGANARQSARGRPLINPERRDEAYAQGAGRAFARAEAGSQEQARTALLQAASGSAGAAGAFTNPNAVALHFGDANDAIAKNVPLLWAQAGRAITNVLGKSFPQTFGAGDGNVGAAGGFFDEPQARLSTRGKVYAG